jgi:hypothetical protein
MLLTITITSILAITLVVWLANRILPFTICPICAGVFLTWIGLVSAHLLGYQIDLVIPALLMGGSVVGIAYQLEKKFRGYSAGALLLWKVFFMPIGFVAAYGVLKRLWVVSVPALVALLLVSLLFLSAHRVPGARENTTDEIEKKMKDCC